MKLIKFRVFNYKSVADSGYCWLASDLTVLAGKNESGKTAILEALRDFDPRGSVQASAFPIDRPGLPRLEAHFALERDELEQLLEPYEALRKELLHRIARDGITLFREHDGQYRFDDAISEVIARIDAEEAERAAEVERERAARLAEEARLAVEEGDDEEEEEEEEEEGEGEDEEEDEGEDEEEGEEEHATPLLEAIVDRLPRFIFSSFEDVLPFEITFTRARTNQSVQDFARVSGLNLSQVAGMTDTQARRNLLSRHSAQISGDFKGYWRQDEITLSASAEGQTLIIGVKEEGRTDTFKVEQRSKGFQWFLSFYLRLHAEGGAERVILIDEPGLYLHARAQRDVLDVLENISQEAEVIFSTHSPYLIDPDRFDRLRLVVKDDDTGSTIQGKVHAGADAETMTPIITAIGLDIAHEFSVAGRQNVLLEGITDYFYLQAFRSYMSDALPDGLTLIPSVGAQKIPQLASLMIGWGLDFVAVLDQDAEGRKAAKVLSEKLLLNEDQIVFAHPDTDAAIEDLFTPGDFRKYVLEGASVDKDKKNSEIIKGEGFDSALLARKFFQLVRNPSAVALTDTTQKRFRQLFEAIVRGLPSEKT